MIAALYVDPDGAYAGIDGVEMWDARRDARLYDGPYPVVAHPPCGAWSMMARANRARWGTWVGDDGGCFAAALRAVRTWGGVLEHPAHSLAWDRYGLRPPVRGGWQRDATDDGWVTEVSQSAYGCPARKRTWLYAVVDDPPDMDYSEPPASAVIAAGVRSGQSAGARRLRRREASATPPAFRDALIAMARSCVEVSPPPVSDGDTRGPRDGGAAVHGR